MLTHFQPTFHFYTPWKHQKTGGFRSGTLVENGLTSVYELFIQNSDYVTYLRVAACTLGNTNIIYVKTKLQKKLILAQKCTIYA